MTSGDEPMGIVYSVTRFGRRCAMRSSMILLVTSSIRAQELAERLEHDLAEGVMTTESLAEAAQRLLERDFEAAIIEQWMADEAAEESDALFSRLGLAEPILVNFAVSGLDRILREVRVKLARRRRLLMTMRAEMERQLRNEMKGTITALLVSCELALQSQGLPDVAENKLRTVDELARELSARLSLS